MNKQEIYNNLNKTITEFQEYLDTNNEEAIGQENTLFSALLEIKNNWGEIQKEDKYNGWTNYATWRIALEFFDNAKPEDYLVFEEDKRDENPTRLLADCLQEEVEETLGLEATGETTALQYADAFINDVNWYEIAEGMIEDNK